MTKPSFNPMIGPSPYILVNMGARFVPCMHNLDGIQNAAKTITWPCPSSTSSDSTLPENQCTLSQLCGFGGIPEPAYTPGTPLNTQPAPNQWYRFIIPIFMHAGIIHIGFNMLLQLTLGRDMEKSIGSIRFFLVYMSAGIFGFVMGGNFAATGIASTGASGSLFGVIALTLLDLLYSWKDRVNPVKDLCFIILDVVISFVLGLLPGLDNFSHIGGFLMGLGLGVCVLHSPNALRRRIGDDVPYASSQVSGGFAAQGTPPSFLKNPIGFFKGRKPLWWAWWLIRAGALVVVLVVFILLLNNFYVYRVTCSWCKYLSCLVRLAPSSSDCVWLWRLTGVFSLSATGAISAICSFRVRRREWARLGTRTDRMTTHRRDGEKKVGGARNHHIMHSSGVFGSDLSLYSFFLRVSSSLQRFPPLFRYWACPVGAWLEQANRRFS